MSKAHIPDWYDDALCAQVGGDDFYPEAGGTTRRVRSICNGDARRGTEPCPVRQQCLDHALDNNEAWGVWGGVSERERRKLRRERGAA